MRPTKSTSATLSFPASTTRTIPADVSAQSGINNQDLALAKSFPFGKEGKHSLQLRVEAFNVFNHTQFSGVNRTTNIVNGLGQAANNASSSTTIPA